MKKLLEKLLRIAGFDSVEIVKNKHCSYWTFYAKRNDLRCPMYFRNDWFPIFMIDYDANKRGTSADDAVIKQIDEDASRWFVLNAMSIEEDVVIQTGIRAKMNDHTLITKDSCVIIPKMNSIEELKMLADMRDIS